MPSMPRTALPMASMRDAKIVKKELLVSRFKKVVQERLRFSDGSEEDWIYLDSPQSVMVVAVTPEKKLVLVRLYRHNIQQDAYELPAGAADKTDASPLDAARRELLEETGYAADSFIDLGAYYVLPGETNRWVHYYLATDAIKTEEPHLDELIEKYFDMSVELFALDALPKMVGLETLFGIQLAQGHLAKVLQ